MTETYDLLVVGGGIVGLATARALLQRLPGSRLAILEKEDGIARHQTGRNSGVLHSGLYYRPGSLKARFTREGREELVELARERGIRHELCGKVVLALDEGEAGRLAALAARAAENGIAARVIGPAELAEREPHAVPDPAGALLVPATGIIDFRAVAAALLADVEAAGGTLLTGRELTAVAPRRGALAIRTSRGALEAGFLVNCAGLHSDRVARLAGAEPGARIVPFRGEYFRLRREAASLVRHLLYPVPDPALPFLGVHLHRTVDGEVWAGPNAVPAARREGYLRRDVDAFDLAETLAFPGFWRLAPRYGATGLAELARSLSRRAFVRSLRRLVPEVRRQDLVPAPAGVRAQALTADGRLVDDFLFADSDLALHVVNAPSPAATACLPIGRYVADRIAAGSFAAGSSAAG